MECLLKEITKLSAQKLTGATMALSFCKRLTQPIQERVHPDYEYWSRGDPTRGQNRKVPWEEAADRVARMMQGPVPKGTLPELADQSHKYSELFRVVLLWF